MTSDADGKPFDNKRYAGWRHIDFDYWHRLYWKSDCGLACADDDGKYGFQAELLEGVTSTGTGDTENVFDDEGVRFDTLFRCDALFDGVRHLYFNPYIYYPNLNALTAALEYLKKLVDENCFLELKP